jgi:dihydroorotase
MTLTIPRPIDAHLHLRSGDYLKRTVQDSSKAFGHAIIMPNLTPPVETLEQAEEYLAQIRAHATFSFHPHLTLYLTPRTTPQLLKQAKQCDFIVGCKLYPQGATTNSDAGLKNLDHHFELFEALEECQLPLLIHGETNHPDVDVFDREQHFIDTTLLPLRQRFPALKMVLEHISTAHAVDFINQCPDHIAATITVHHLLLNRNDLFQKGLSPHHYCCPIIKDQKQQQALLSAALNGSNKFFLGTDSAPHARKRKESANAPAGIYTAPAAIELVTELFELHQKLDRLPAFTSLNAANFYNFSENFTPLTLEKDPWTVPEFLEFGDDVVIPLFAGKTIPWRIKTS